MAETKQESLAPSLHVVVFPWLAFGHMIPFMELSQQLAKRGHLVTFVSTPRNLARLRPIPAEFSSRVRLVSLSLPAVDGLPEGAESTADVPPEKIELLKVAFDGLATPFSSFLAEASAGGDASPDWIVVDFSHHWVPPIADQHKVPCAVFQIVPAAFLAFLGPKALNDAHPRTVAEDFTIPPPWIPALSPLAYRLHEAQWVAQVAFRPNASGIADVARFWETMQRCPVVMYRGCRELDGPLCPLLQDLLGKPVVPAGLLVPHDACDDDDDEETAISILRWLDAQPARSVLYVAFGTEAPLTPVHVREIALGLELAGVRFLWALRNNTSGELLLDDNGFEARVGERGIVHVGWVPQLRVLAHAAVGAFLTHCGWGSIIESLFRFGHPLVMLPFIVDQGLIARAMVARGVGVEVQRNDTDGSFSKEDVAAAVRRVMAEDEGEGLARNARELHKVLGDSVRQEHYFDELVHSLQRSK